MELQKRCEYFLIPTAAESWFVCVWLICVALKTIPGIYKNLSHLGLNIHIKTYVISPKTGEAGLTVVPHQDGTTREQNVEILTKNEVFQSKWVQFWD